MAMFVAEMYAYREKEATAVWEGYKRIPTQLLGEVIVNHNGSWMMKCNTVAQFKLSSG